MTCNFDKDELILKVLDGRATPEEILALFRWIETDSANEEYFNQLKKAWNLTSGPISSKEREEKEFQIYMDYIRSRRRTYNLHRIYKYAAIMILPLLAGIYLLQRELTVKDTRSVVVAAKIEPGGYKAILTTAMGNTISLFPSDQEAIQVDEHISVTNGQAGIVYNNTKSTETSLQYNILQTPRGGEYTVTLSDGTRVYLNAASKIKYPVVFDEQKREVYLSGEAYFEVTKDVDRPFYVMTDAVRVKVYGTEFNVNTYSTRSVQTVLVSGKVGISGKDSKEEYMLGPSQLAEFSDEGVFKGIREVNPATYTAWRDGRLVFENEGLEEILNRLSRWYNVDVFYSNEKVKGYHFTGHMEKYEDIEIILRAISKMVGVHFTIKDKTIVVTE
ncbi:FecR family protein [Butyricimonas sp.]|uniref:FecR family protein n=1 Tax=Butyricimonas sp. TaxID=1969738 RepID=UPI0025C0E479|nr:FecR family protein [Butyricimonas sp.]